MRPAHITGHAIERFAERVANIPEAEIIRELDTPAIHAAIAFAKQRECFVKLTTGHRAVICEGKVVTVNPLPKRKKMRVIKHG